MKLIYAFALSFLFALFIQPVSAENYWNSSFDLKIPIHINCSASDSVVNYSLMSQDISSYNINYQSARIVNRTSGELVPGYWVEQTDSGNLERVWINATFPTGGWVNDTYAIYYQSTQTASTISDGESTFPFYDDFNSAFNVPVKWYGDVANATTSGGVLIFDVSSENKEIYSSVNSTGTSMAMKSSSKIPTGFRGTVGLKSQVPTQDVGFFMYEGQTPVTRLASNAGSFVHIGSDWSDDTFNYYARDIRVIGGVSATFDERAAVSGTIREVQGSPKTVQIPNQQMGVYIYSNNNIVRVNWILLREYTANEPCAWTLGTLTYYSDSLIYGQINNVGSDGSVTVDSLTPDTDWTTTSAGSTTFEFTTAVTPGGSTKFTTTGDALTWLTVDNLNPSIGYTVYNATTVIGSFTTDSNGDATFTPDIYAGDIVVVLTSTIGSPVLSSISNNISSDYYPKLQIGDYVNVSVTKSSPLPVDYLWYVDDVLQGSSYDNISVTWNTTGSKNVTVYATNAYGTSGELYNYPTVLRTMATAGDVHATYSEDAIDDVLTSIDNDTPDMIAFFAATFEPYTGVMGSIFYLVLYGLPMLLIWISSKKMIIPVGLTTIFGIFFLGSIPISIAGVAILCVLITTTGIIVSLAKDRGT